MALVERWLLTACIALAAVCVAADAAAQSYPSKPIRMIVPFPPGGGFDGIARPFAERLSTLLEQPVVVENRPGAGGNVGADMAVRAPADGYTILFAGDFLTTNPYLYKSIPYDPERDLVPVSKIGSTPQAIAVNPGVPAKDLKELFTYSQTKTLNYGTPGIGTSPHLMAETLRMESGFKVNHVPYKGTGPAIVDTISGQVDMVITTLPSLMTNIRAGKLRGIAVLSTQRSAILPDLPTVGEAGFAPIDGDVWYALFVPKGTPAAIVARLNEATNAALKQPELAARLRGIGYEPSPGTAEELQELMKRSLARWGKVVKAAQISAE